MKYIDAERLKTIIEERKTQQDQWVERYHDPINQGISNELAKVLFLVDSLQQEQPKMNILSAGSGAMGTIPPKFKLDVKPVEPMDLEKEIEDYCGAYENRPVPDFIEAVAKHFFELGQREMRHRIMNPEYNAKVIEQLKSEYPTIIEE